MLVYIVIHTLPVSHGNPNMLYVEDISRRDLTNLISGNKRQRNFHIIIVCLCGMLLSTYIGFEGAIVQRRDDL